MIPTKNRTNNNSTRLLRTRWLAVSAFCTLSVALLLTLAAGCGPTERQRVQTVSDQFLDAMSQKDWERAKPLLTEKARDAMGGLNPFPQNNEPGRKSHVTLSPRIENYTLGEPNIEDTVAVIPVTLTGTGHSTVGMLRLRREDSEWRIRALRIEGKNDDPGITLDFENPEAALLESTFRAVGEGIGEILKGAGKGIGAFLEGVEQGAAAARKSTDTTVPEEPTDSPQPSPDSGGSVKIKEHSSGS